MTNARIMNRFPIGCKVYDVSVVEDILDPIAKVWTPKDTLLKEYKVLGYEITKKGFFVLIKPDKHLPGEFGKVIADNLEKTKTKAVKAHRLLLKAQSQARIDRLKEQVEKETERLNSL